MARPSAGGRPVLPGLLGRGRSDLDGVRRHGRGCRAATVPWVRLEQFARSEGLEAWLNGAYLSGGSQFLQVLRLQELQGLRFDAVVPVDIE